MRSRFARRLATIATLTATAGVVLTGCTTSEPMLAPDVTGMTLDEAAAVLDRFGIGVGESWPWHNNYNVVPVTSQDPAPGERVKYPYEVTIFFAEVTVTNVVDGDTIDLSTGDRVRLIGVDTPEAGSCGADAATAAVKEIVEGASVEVDNPVEVEDRDEYGRLLAYISVPQRVTDLGYYLVSRGYAVPRYNSTDGYTQHPNEPVYAEGAQDAPDLGCGSGAVEEPTTPPDPPQTRKWTCSYSPTYDNDWHNDVLCSNGADKQRPYLREWDSFVTQDEIMSAAREYEDQLNHG